MIGHNKANWSNISAFVLGMFVKKILNMEPLYLAQAVRMGATSNSTSKK